jgi:hypothetical protein
MSEQIEDSKVDNLFPDEPKRKPRRSWRMHGSIFWPLLLVALGVLFLLANTGYIEGDPVSLILRLWPIILIVGGLDGLLRRDGVVGPGFWAAAGVLLLLANLELVPWDAWTIASALWPLIIVSIGLDLLFGRRSFWLGLVGLAVVVAIMLGSLMLLNASTARGVQINQPVPAADQARIVLKPVIGSLKVESGAAGGDLVSGTVPTGRRSQVSPQYDDTTQTLTLERTGMPVMLTPAESSGWDLALSPDIPLTLDTEMALGRVDFDLTGLTIEEFNLSLPMGTARIVLPAGDSFGGSIDLPMGSLEIVVPAGVGFKLIENGGVVAIDVPDGYEHSGGTYTSPGYDSAAVKIDLIVNTGMGRIAVTQK